MRCGALALTVVLILLVSPTGAMRLVLQRVRAASVTVDGTVVSSIGKGVLALVGLHTDDTNADLQYCAKKLCAAKLWPNEEGKPWRKSVKQLGYDVLCVSQFTLYGDVRNKKHVRLTTLSH
jgi:D-tyrosyl-tRNA(Tyr) deacylase